MLFLFFFFSRKKENAIFLVTFFGQAKKRNAPAAAETALTATTKHKYKTENYPQQQHIIDNQNSLPLEGGGFKNGRKINRYANDKNDNTKPKPLINLNKCVKQTK
ncbi:MAG: hypothetical protein R3Y27_06790, partial [Clostridia bacterium]